MNSVIAATTLIILLRPTSPSSITSVQQHMLFRHLHFSMQHRNSFWKTKVTPVKEPQKQTQKYLTDFRLPLRCKWELRSSGLLRSERWQFLTDVSGQLHSWPLKMGPIGCPETSAINYHYSRRNEPVRAQSHKNTHFRQKKYNEIWSFHEEEILIVLHRVVWWVGGWVYQRFWKTYLLWHVSSHQVDYSPATRIWSLLGMR